MTASTTPQSSVPRVHGLLTNLMQQRTNSKPAGPIRRRLRLLDKAVQFLSRLDGRVPHPIHEVSLNTSFHSLPLSQVSERQRV
jgi:hypothetical protein